MYNLLISADDESWLGKPFVLETNRFLEYTENEIKAKFEDLSENVISQLMRLPCIFAYEDPLKIDPKFGLITDITVREQRLKISFEIVYLEKGLTYEEFAALEFELDLRGWEANRTHWAIKDINLYKELKATGVVLPNWVQKDKISVDIRKHFFDVAFSFPGEIRDYVEGVAFEIEKVLGPNSYFYDNNYIAQLARPRLDTLLQDIYRNRSKLVVVFLCQAYQEKEWCGLEFRAISELLKKKLDDLIMFIKIDDGRVEGVFETDGYIDARVYPPRDIAQFIIQRLKHL